MVGILAGIGAGLASGLLQTGSQFGLQAMQQSFNAQEAQKQRDFEAQMSSSAYQRAVQDMQKAGINPASLGGSLSSASTPQGVSASSSLGSASSFGGISSAVNSYFIRKASEDKNLAQAFFLNERGKALASAMAYEKEARFLKENLDLNRASLADSKANYYDLLYKRLAKKFY